MTDIEVKCKELEAAKRIRDNGYTCEGLPGCKEMECPCDPNPSRQGGCRLWNQNPEKWDTFISTREAELAALEETPHDGVCQKCLGEGFYYTKGATTMEAVKRTCECQTGAYSKPRLYIGKDGKPEYIMPIGPTLDDFALALIQGGYYVYLAEQGVGDDDDREETVYGAAELLKKAADRRREA